MKLAAILLLAFLPAPLARGGATIEGVVTFPKGHVMAPMARYQARPQPGRPDPPAAIVYLEGNFSGGSTNSIVEVGQRQYQFTPGLVAVQKGARVRFPNYDDDYHSVFSLSKSKRFDLGRYRKNEEPASVVFDQAGVVKLYCEIHEHMRGTILVLETPYFTKTTPDGKYALTNLPAGTFKLKVWLDEKATWEKPVELKDGQTFKVDFAPK